MISSNRRLGGNDPTCAGDDPAMAKHEQMRQRLEKLAGVASDQAYLEERIRHHAKDISEFERAAQSSNAQSHAFSERTLPTRREHLQTSQQLSQTIR